MGWWSVNGMQFAYGFGQGSVSCGQFQTHWILG